MATKSPRNGEKNGTFAETAQNIGRAAASVAELAMSPLFLPGVQRVTRPALKAAAHVYLAASDAASSSASWISDTIDSTGSAREHLSEIVDEARRERTRALKQRTNKHAERDHEPAARGHGKHRGQRSHRAPAATA